VKIIDQVKIVPAQGRYSAMKFVIYIDTNNVNVIAEVTLLVLEIY
jgi:hypothetical protein